MTLLLSRFGSLKHQLLLGLTVVFIAAIVGGTSYALVYKRDVVAADRGLKTLESTVRLNNALREAVTRQTDILRARPDQLGQRHDQLFIDLGFDFGDIRTQYLRLDIGESERLIVEDISKLATDLSVVSLLALRHLRAGRMTDANEHLGKVNFLSEALDHEFRELNAVQLRALRENVVRQQRSVSAGYGIIVVAIAGFVSVLLFLRWWFRILVMQPVNVMLEMSDRIRDGDFTARVPITRHNELAHLATGVNHMADSLEQVYSDLEDKVRERTRQLESVQEQLVESAKMAAVGQLVSGVAHEVNNPLSVIMGAVELANLELEESQPQRVRARLEVIADQIERCKRIVKNLLQFARRQKSTGEPVSVNDVANEVLALREYEFTTRNIKIVRDFDSSDPVVEGDRDKLQQLLLNLLNNAYDAVHNTSRAGQVWLRTLVEGNSVIVEVKDTGPGIEHPERVFEPFFTTKEPGRGTGLGLSVCYGIVQQHGGTITADNWESGARLVVCLPTSERQVSVTKGVGPAQNSEVPNCLSAIVVEDEEQVAEVITSYLAYMGVSALWVSSGQSAIDHIEKNRVDLIVSDLRMPGPIDGIDLFEWIGKHRSELRERFIVVSGDLSGIDTKSGDLPPSIIQKPFSLELFKSEVLKVLEQ